MKKFNLSLLTDFYELTMLNGYYKIGNNQKAVFDMFFRKNPFSNGYSIMAGLAHLIDYITEFKFDDEDITYLRSLNTFDEDFLDYLKNFKFTGDIYAIEEGRLIFPKEPIVKVIAPIAQAQIIETALLNIINYESLIATKASRIANIAKDNILLEYGLRRAQGPDAGIYGSRAAIIGGFHATSNVLAGKLFNIPISGTHAHSWIMSFNSEYEAFITYANIYPNSCILLVDTYDTLKSGVPNAIKAFRYIRQKGIKLKNYGIRLDSGDIAYLSKRARKMLDEAGFNDAIITASNDIDEEILMALKEQGCRVDAWGIGTKLITSEGNSSFGGVYKLVALYNENKSIPKIKLSNNPEKITNPGNKEVYRIHSLNTNKIKGDYITLVDEEFDTKKDLEIFDPNNTWKRTLLEGGTYKFEKMLKPIFKEGKLVYKSPSIDEIRQNVNNDLATLWDENKRLINPQPVFVDLSDKLYELRNKLFYERHRTDESY